MKERRIGKFIVAHRDIEACPELVIPIFENLIIVRAELCYASDAIEYIALGEQFPLTVAGALIPEYSIEICTEETSEGTRVKEIKFVD